MDVHVHRISNRLGLVNTKTPEQTEQALMEAVPKRHWKEINNLFVKFGQNVCKPVKPKCEGWGLIGIVSIIKELYITFWARLFSFKEKFFSFYKMRFSPFFALKTIYFLVKVG